MEMIQQFLERLQYRPRDIRTYSPLALAYVGDNVYDLFMRMMVVSDSDGTSGQYHNKVVQYVKAQGQKSFFQRIEEDLTEEEKAIFRRGRNAKTLHLPKHASRQEYSVATGVESLIGYLFLTGQTERLAELMAKGVEDGKADQKAD